MEENTILDLQAALKDDTQKFQITFKLSSETINVDFYKFCKYSKLIQKQFQLNDIKLDIFQDCERIQKEYNIKKESITKFFELLQNEKGSISNDQYTDLYKLSDLFEVTSLQNLLNVYAKKNSKNLDFIINIITDQQKESNSKISIEMENILRFAIRSSSIVKEGGLIDNANLIINAPNSLINQLISPCISRIIN